MFAHHQVLTAVGQFPVTLLTVDSAQFDGTNDYMTRGADLNGSADGKTGILSCWLRLDGGDATTLRFFGSYTAVGGPNRIMRVERDTSNKFVIEALNSGGFARLSIHTTNSYVASSSWIHFLASWDLANTTSSIYINDVSDQTVLTLINDTLDYTCADWAIGAVASGINKFNGCLAELYFAPNQYLDFSIANNRRKFVSASVKPVYMGTDGSLPTGTAPLVYQHLADGETVANFATNRGTGGNFTITGALTTGSTSPSD